MNLHIGGQQRRDSWRILKVQPGPDVDFVGDIRDLGQFGNDTLDQAYASPVLEHAGQAALAAVIQDIRRALKVGGRAADRRTGP